MGNFIETSVIGISDTSLQSLKKDVNKQIFKKYIYYLYVFCTFILRFNVKLFLYKSIFKNFNVRWD